MSLTEKYRPISLEEIILPGAILNLIKKYIAEKNVPNLLLYSESPGTGKSSLANIIISSLNNEFLELNASKERGIDIIRETIEPFIITYSFNSNKKAILLSECEQLTSISQKALKDLMEGKFVKNNYYILTTNQKTKIIKPIKSRCVELDFAHPPKDKIKEKLQLICNNEKIEIEEPDIESIIDSFYPDIRKMINTLDKIANGLDITDAIGSEMNFYKLVAILSPHIKAKELYNLIDEIPVVGFLHYLFKVFLSKNNGKGVIFVNDAMCNIMGGVNEKIAFIANWFRIMPLTRSK